jgi:hypothetical protein
MTREFYRIITPFGYANLEDDSSVGIKQKLKDFGGTPDNEYYKANQKRMLECEMVKVTEITTPIL